MGFLSKGGRNKITGFKLRHKVTSSKAGERRMFLKILNFRIFNIGVTGKVMAFGEYHPSED